MKKCPFCAEDIQDAAIVCKHCGRDLVAKPPEPALPAWEQEARALARDGKVVHSIKRIREATGLSLRDAKDLADRWQRGEDVRPPATPPPTKSPAARGCSGCLIAIVGLFVIGAILSYLVGSGPSGSSRATAEPTETQAGIICNRFVEQRLKSPKSADFRMFDRTVVKTGPGSFRVVSYVDAQNSFGAALRTRFECKLTYKGGEWADQNSWTVDDISFAE